MPDETPPPMMLVVNVPSAGDTVILHLTNAAAELPQHWQVGRAADCAVRVADKTVSTHHMTIRAEPIVGGNNYDLWGRRRYLWLFKDNGSTNGTFQDGIKIGGRGHPCPWIEIEDNDAVFLARQKIRFSFDGQFTDSDREDMTATPVDPPTDPTAGETPTDIRAPQPASQPTTMWDIVKLLLTGPRDLSNWAWWLMLAAIASGVTLAIEWIRSH